MGNLNNVKKKVYLHASARKGCDLVHMKNKTKLVCPFYFFIRHP